MLQVVMGVVSTMGDWYVSLSSVYIFIFGSVKEPHYSLDHIILLEVAYQTYVSGFTVAMIRKNKLTWLKLPLQVGAYKVENVKQVVIEAEIFIVYRLRNYHFIDMR